MHGYSARVAILGLLGLTMAGLTGCEKRHFKWTEEVRLSDGTSVTVERVTRYGRVNRELGGPTSKWVSEASVTILDRGQRLPTWSHPMEPFLLDRDPSSGRWLLVASAVGYCDYASRFGQPFVTFPTFELRGSNWEYIGLPDAMLNRIANLVQSVPERKRHITASDAAMSNARSSLEWRSVHPSVIGFCALEHSRK
jgi:hypothetical protein